MDLPAIEAMTYFTAIFWLQFIFEAASLTHHKQLPLSEVPTGSGSVALWTWTGPEVHDVRSEV